MTDQQQPQHPIPPLLVDDRERAVTGELAAVARERQANPQALYEVQRLTHGDFAIRGATGEILAIIERKTYDDLAQSIRDGRIDNIPRMIEGVPLARPILLIEGAPGATALFSGIPYQHLRAKIWHLLLRDGVTPLETPTTRESARLLLEIAHHSTTLRLGGNPAGPLTAPRARPIAEDVARMFAAFPGVGKKTADQFCAMGLSICELVTGAPMRDARITRVRARYTEHGDDIMILGEVLGMTPTTARDLAQVGLVALCSLSEDEIAALIPRVRARRALATRVRNCLHFAGEDIDGE